jgi:hypothetical protein
LLDSLHHPFELVPGSEAQAALEAAQALGRTKGFCPLLIQPGFDGKILTESISLKDSKVRLPAEYFDWQASGLARDTDGLALFDDVEEVEWNARPVQLYLVDGLSETRPLSPFAEVAILRLPCAESWKIPLFADFIGPYDDTGRTRGDEIGIEKAWHDQFGAELCCVGPRSWQFRVTRPPQDHRQAVQLLRQHYLYSWVDAAYDEETIENSAAALRVDAYWQFFWT